RLLGTAYARGSMGLVGRLGYWLRRDCRAALRLGKPKQVIQRVTSVTDRVGPGDGLVYIRLGQHYALSRALAVDQVRQNRSRERAAHPMEMLQFPPRAGEDLQLLPIVVHVGGPFQVAPGDHNMRRPLPVKQLGRSF